MNAAALPPRPVRKTIGMLAGGNRSMVEGLGRGQSRTPARAWFLGDRRISAQEAAEAFDAYCKALELRVPGV